MLIRTGICVEHVQKLRNRICDIWRVLTRRSHVMIWTYSTIVQYLFSSYKSYSPLNNAVQKSINFPATSTLMLKRNIMFVKGSQRERDTFIHSRIITMCPNIFLSSWKKHKCSNFLNIQISIWVQTVETINISIKGY